MKGKPTYIADYYEDIVVAGAANSLVALQLIGAGIFFTVEPMPDGVLRFYVKEEAKDILLKAVLPYSPSMREERCVFCGKAVPDEEAHLHEGRWVGNCCWDERLRTTQ